jgi:hypothetical protein
MHTDRRITSGNPCDVPGRRNVPPGQDESRASVDRDCQLIFCPRCGATIRETIAECPLCHALVEVGR